MKKIFFATLFFVTAALYCYQSITAVKRRYNEPVASASNAMLISQNRPLTVLIVDGFSNHDWKQTTAVTKWILEGSGLFTVSVSTIPSDSIQRSQWAPKFSDYAWLFRIPIIFKILHCDGRSTPSVVWKSM